MFNIVRYITPVVLFYWMGILLLLSRRNQFNSLTRTQYKNENSSLTLNTFLYRPTKI